MFNLTIYCPFFYVEVQINEATEVGLLQEQVAPPGAGDHLIELERCGSLYQDDPAWKPRYDLLPKPQKPVRLTCWIKAYTNYVAGKNKCQVNTVR